MLFLLPCENIYYNGFHANNKSYERTKLTFTLRRQLKTRSALKIAVNSLVRRMGDLRRRKSFENMGFDVHSLFFGQCQRIMEISHLAPLSPGI